MSHQPGRRARALLIGVAAAAAFSLPTEAAAQFRGPFGGVGRQLQEISAKLEKLDDLYVPFKVQISGGLCNSAAQGSSNPKIIVDGDGTDPFVLTSVLVKRGFQNPTDFLFLMLNGVEINGTFFETRTGNLFDPLFGEFAVQQSADILGMPVNRGGNFQMPEPGGSVPHQIVADAGGVEDVRFTLFCRSDNRDLDIETILVAGWKKVGDTVSVSYVAGE